MTMAISQERLETLLVSLGSGQVAQSTYTTRDTFQTRCFFWLVDTYRDGTMNLYATDGTRLFDMGIGRERRVSLYHSAREGLTLAQLRDLRAVLTARGATRESIDALLVHCI